MSELSAENECFPQLRLMLEELCTELCRFEHVVEHRLQPEQVRIRREFYLGQPGTYADIRVDPLGLPSYFVEVKVGYSSEQLLRHLRRKYSEIGSALNGVNRLILVIDEEGRPNWPQLQEEIKNCLHPSLALEVWDLPRLTALLSERFQTDIRSITPDTLLDVRQAIDRTKGFYAFGGESLSSYEDTHLNAELLWHFGFWKLRQLREANQLSPREILPPGLYRGVAVLLADICSFSSYVRDTPDNRVIRGSLTSFYSMARYQIINNGGMLYQFVGDEVVGLFGIPERSEGFAQAAVDTALSLVSIGNSVSHHWQRQLDRVQASCGLHIGIAIGDLQVVSLRPYSRSHLGAVGDCINVAARLMAAAGPSEIVVSNSFHQSLDNDTQANFEEILPVEAKNVGCIKAWKMSSM